MELSDRNEAKYIRIYHNIDKKINYVEYYFLNGKLITCTIHAPSYVLKNYFTSRYGKPTSTADRSVYNFQSIRNNGTYDAKDPEWDGVNATAMMKTVSEYRSLVVVGFIEQKQKVKDRASGARH